MTTKALAAQPVMDLEPARPGVDLLGVIERLSTNKDVDVAKLEQFMALYERAQARLAQSAFDAAMSAAQTEMRPVAANADNPQTRSRYANYAALDSALRPIYTRHGFGLSFDTADAPMADCVRVIAHVSHRDGHRATFHVDMPADGKGARGGDVMTKTHATGAALTYGMRYLLKLVFNVAVSEDDTDGNMPVQPPPQPNGFDEWLCGLESASMEGHEALAAAWKSECPEGCKVYLTKHMPARWESIKKNAKDVDRG
jgi:hypothetical protein